MKPMRYSREIPVFDVVSKPRKKFADFRYILIKPFRRKLRFYTCNGSLIIVIKHIDFNWQSLCSLTLYKCKVNVKVIF
jgi:hypothetical protein